MRWLIALALWLLGQSAFADSYSFACSGTSRTITLLTPAQRLLFSVPSGSSNIYFNLNAQAATTSSFELPAGNIREVQLSSPIGAVSVICSGTSGNYSLLTFN